MWTTRLTLLSILLEQTEKGTTVLYVWYTPVGLHTQHRQHTRNRIGNMITLGSYTIALGAVRLGWATAPKSSNLPVSANLGSFRSHHSNPVSRLSSCPFNSHATVHPLLCGPSFPLQSAHFLTPTPVLHHSKLFHQASSLRSPFNLRITQRLFLPFSQIFTLFHPSSTNH